MARWERLCEEGQQFVKVRGKYRGALEKLPANFLYPLVAQEQAVAAAPTEETSTVPIKIGTEERYKLHATYPEDDYNDDFRRAIALFITGANLRRIVKGGYLRYIENILTKNGEVRVLMNHPKSRVCVNAMVQDIGIDVEPCTPDRHRGPVETRTGPDLDINQYRKLVHNSLRAFCGIRATTAYGKNLRIRVTPIMLAFGLDICFFDAEKKTGSVYVRFYPLPDIADDHKDKPIIKVNHSDRQWYDNFKNEFDRQWASPTRGGLALDVPLDYPWQSSWEEVCETLKEPEFPLFAG